MRPPQLHRLRLRHWASPPFRSLNYTLGLGLAEGLCDADGLELGEKLAEGDGDSDGERLIDALGLWLALGLIEGLTDELGDGEPDADNDPLGLGEPEGEALGLSDVGPVPSGVCSSSRNDHAN